jgi:hypothetical protein
LSTTDGVVGVDGDDDVVAVAGQRLVDGVVHHLEHQVVQAGAVGGVADVHARALAHRLQAFQDLDGLGAIAAGAWGRGGLLAVGGGGGVAHGASGNSRKRPGAAKAPGFETLQAVPRSEAVPLVL